MPTMNTPKVYHKAKLVSPEGDISPLCATNPRKLNLKKELWALNDNAVTCKQCLKRLRAVR